MDNCLPSGGKTVKVKGETVQAVFFEGSISDLYRKFCEKKGEKVLSYSTFCKLRPPQCVRSKIRTDVCEKCKFLSSLKKKPSLSRQDERLFKELTEHREGASKQREKFKEDLSRLKHKKKDCVILIDFKENHKCWKSKEQTSKSFYNALSVTIFNVSVFFGGDDGQLKVHNWTFCSNNLSHDSFFVKEALAQLFEHPEFKSFGFKRVKFWMDGGPHFRSHELNAFFYNLEKLGKFKKVVWNHFIEYHGKNYCDVQFSVVSHILKVRFLVF